MSDSAYKIALAKIREAQAAGATELNMALYRTDFGSERLQTLPDELFELKHLKAECLIP